MAGYSGKPLSQKLGLKAGMRMALVDAPKGYLGILDPPGKPGPLKAGMDFIQLFSSTAQGLEKTISQLKSKMAAGGMLWISWPKKGSALRKDLEESQVRAMGLSAGLVDVKVCAVDEDWSALKFVIPLKDRR